MRAQQEGTSPVKCLGQKGEDGSNIQTIHKKFNFTCLNYRTIDNRFVFYKLSPTTPILSAFILVRNSCFSQHLLSIKLEPWRGFMGRFLPRIHKGL